MSDAPDRDALAAEWARFAEQECRGYSPLYDHICQAVAVDTDLLELVAEGPPPARQPNLLLAAVHDLLLSGVEHPLGEVYAGRSSADPAPLFRDICLSHRDEVLQLLSTRRTQTNECGRSGAIVPALRWVADRLGEPLALVDVGASAGLNLLCDQVRIDYGPHGATGPPDSPVQISCRVAAGHPPIRPTAPALASRLGLDRRPVDLEDPEARRWLLACVWPDTGRLHRTAAAIELARRARPQVVRGSAAEDVASILADLPNHVVPCVVTTWVLAYLRPEHKAAFVDQLVSSAQDRPIVWIAAEHGAIGVGEMVDPGPPPRHDLTTPSLLGATLFSGTDVDPTVLGWVHPHGTWIDWRA